MSRHSRYPRRPHSLIHHLLAMQTTHISVWSSLQDDGGNERLLGKGGQTLCLQKQLQAERNFSLESDWAHSCCPARREVQDYRWLFGIVHTSWTVWVCVRVQLTGAEEQLSEKNQNKTWKQVQRKGKNTTLHQNRNTNSNRCYSCTWMDTGHTPVSVCVCVLGCMRDRTHC